MQIVATMFWRRLDLPGHDACRLEKHSDGWQLDGAAVFRSENGQPARLDYRVHCDKAWHAKWGRVRGWVGSLPVDFAIARAANGEWSLNDQRMPDLAHCTDLDLGFTPATNLLPLRRLNLQVGESAEAPAAWLDLDDEGLSALAQHYERRSEIEYWYQSPRFDYEGLLLTTPDGFVTHYPTLWQPED
ncbi:putative glycolipid-binding domain-containing protein [Variovorax sp. DT-64]|uniref:putative glycolipid-binding domain-containing protein n=1 Tax=Variovorax sp. DT-64 TaxID=3396160 RepID=UPI003F19D062